MGETNQIAGVDGCQRGWIVSKIAEVDASLAAEHQGRIVEFHPELTWMRLAGRVLESKHTATGIIERLRIVSRFGIDVSALSIDDLSDARAKADITDALDALASLAVSTGAQRLSANAAGTDNTGRAIEIRY